MATADGREGLETTKFIPNWVCWLILEINRAVALVKYALRAIILGVNGDCAGRQNLVMLDINPIASGTQPKLAPPHGRHCTPNASASSCGRASGCKAQTLQPAPPRVDSPLVWCDDCGHDYFVPYSCKVRGVCPSCNTRHMVKTATHLTDHVFPRLPVRQWVPPKRSPAHYLCAVLIARFLRACGTDHRYAQRTSSVLN